MTSATLQSILKLSRWAEYVPFTVPLTLFGGLLAYRFSTDVSLDWRLLSVLAANCLAVGYAANATASGIEIRDMSIDLEGELDLHTFLGLAPGGNAGYDNISVKVNIDSDASAEQLQELHEKVVGTSPVGHTLSRAVPLKIDLA